MENKVKRGMKLTPTTTGMICREHTGEQRLERRCEGPCNQIKTLADFSKNTLANNRNVSGGREDIYSFLQAVSNFLLTTNSGVKLAFSGRRALTTRRPRPRRMWPRIPLLLGPFLFSVAMTISMTR